MTRTAAVAPAPSKMASMRRARDSSRPAAAMGVVGCVVTDGVAGDVVVVDVDASGVVETDAQPMMPRRTGIRASASVTHLEPRTLVFSSIRHPFELRSVASVLIRTGTRAPRQYPTTTADGSSHETAPGHC